MKVARWSSMFVLTVAGCMAPSSPHDPAVVGDEDSATPDTGASGSSEPGAPPASCAVSGAPGTIALQALVSPRIGAQVLAADRVGNVFYVGPDGVTKVDAKLDAVFSYAHGQVIAVDASGNLFVAGAFREPTDFGTGVIRPAGNVDVFLAKLSPSGEVLSVATLGECGGDGVRSMALNAAGDRVAISGDAMGTVVVDPNGAIVYSEPAVGYVAFDTKGRLVIAGSFASGIDLGNGHRLSTTGSADVDGFVARYEAAGRYEFSRQIGDVALPYSAPWGDVITTPRNQFIAGVATGPDDSIAITGAFRYEIELDGQAYGHPPDASTSGPFAGTFTAKLDATGAYSFAALGFSSNAGIEIGGTVMFDGAGLPPRPGTAIAVNADGDIFVSSNEYGDAQPPFAYPQLTKLDGATGAVLWGLYNGSGVSGYGNGVALDGCGNVVWATNENTPDILDPHTALSKLPQ